MHRVLAGQISGAAPPPCRFLEEGIVCAPSVLCWLSSGTLGTAAEGTWHTGSGAAACRALLWQARCCTSALS